jgi:glutamate-1-semialdehyde 2,1-aminomutase
MERVAPIGPVYQAGTLSGNPLAMAAGLATLDLLADPARWNAAADWAAAATDCLTRIARAADVALVVHRVGTIFTPFFTAEPVRDYSGARRADRARYARFFHLMLAEGIYLPPSPFEAAFTSAAHGTEELARFEAATTGAMARLVE